jgi:hypothetical protein
LHSSKAANTTRRGSELAITEFPWWMHWPAEIWEAPDKPVMLISTYRDR